MGRQTLALRRPVWYICKVLVGPGTPYLGPDTKQASRAPAQKEPAYNGRTKAVRDGRRNNNLIG
jgi:hypothetical protein